MGLGMNWTRDWAGHTSARRCPVAEDGTKGLRRRRGMGHRQEAGDRFSCHHPSSGQEIQGVPDPSKARLALQLMMEAYLVRGENILNLIIFLACLGTFKYLDLSLWASICSLVVGPVNVRGRPGKILRARTPQTHKAPGEKVRSGASPPMKTPHGVSIRAQEIP